MNTLGKAFGFLPAIVALTSLAPTIAAAEQRKLTLDAGGLHSLRISAGAGELRVNGVEGADRIEVIANVEPSDADETLTLEKSGATAVLTSDTLDHSFWFGQWPRIDLVVNAPARLKLAITDGSGAIELSGMRAGADIDDGSGSIDVDDISGDVSIDDGSGELSVQHIVGNVKIRDGSGALRVSNVDGHVSIDDGSGSIDVSKIKRGLKIRDGSGGVYTDDIQGTIDIRD